MSCPSVKTVLGLVLIVFFFNTNDVEGSAIQTAEDMSIDKFIGTWQETSKINFDALADATGLPEEKKAFFKNSKSLLKYSREGDVWTIEVGIVGINQGQTYTFKFGEPYDSANIDGTLLKSVIREDGGKMVEEHTSMGPKKFTMDIVRSIDGDVMNATTTVNGVSMYAMYDRVQS